MRRLAPLLLSAACLLGSLSVALGAPEDASARRRAVVTGNVLVRLDRATLDGFGPAFRGRSAALRAHGGALHSVLARPDGTLTAVVLARGGRRTTLEVTPADQPLVLTEASPVRLAAPEARGGPARLVRDEDLLFGEIASADPEVYAADVPRWYLTRLPRAGRARVALDPSALAPRGATPLRIRARVVGTHLGEVRVRATWGALDLGETSVPSAAGGADLVFEAELARAPRGAEAVFELRDVTPSVLPSTDPNDVSDDVGALWVDSVTLEAPEAGLAGARAVLDDGYEVALGSLDAAAWRAPPPPADPEALERARGAAMVVVTTAELEAGARRLAAHRTAGGVPTVVVRASDVWDRYALGVPDPEALRRFLEQVGAGGRPRFVLLCGDATYDRGDLLPIETIPTLYARTLYNGATAADALLVTTRPGLEAAPALGRLPFRDAATLDAYVDRVIALERAPPADASRRRLRFVTSEGRFGPQIDALLENLFSQTVATQIPPAYDVEVSFARPASPWGWPAPEFNDKVIEGLNAGALLYTYVGHGFARGFDHLRVDGRRFPILDAEDAPRIDVKGTPPAVFVVACTTGIYDLPQVVGIGELLLGRPRGPVAYWGATRICHPAWNSLVGRELAIESFRDPARPLGETIAAAVRSAAGAPRAEDAFRRTIELGARLMLRGTRADLERLKAEGAAMYGLLGDPALRLPYPREDLVVEARLEGADWLVTARGPLPDGAEVVLSLETRRDRVLPYAPDAALSPEENLRRRHARSNDQALARATARVQGGAASVRLALPAGAPRPAVAKAWAVADGDVHQGAVALP